MKILIIPNTTNIFDFKKIYKDLSVKYHVDVLIWNSSIKKFFINIPNKSKIHYKKYPYWNIKDFHSRYVEMNFFLKIISIFKDYFWSKKLLQKRKYDRIISFGDRETSLNLSILKFAKLYKVPIFINVNFKSGNIKDLINRRIRSRKFKPTRKNNLFYLFFKNQFRSFKSGTFVSFYSKLEIIIFKLINILPYNPWVVGGGNSDFVFVENSLTLNDYVKLGCPKKKLYLSHSIDTLNILNTKFKIRRKKNLLVLLSQLYEHGDISKSDNRKSLNKLGTFLQNLKKNLRINILICLHPKQNLKDYMWMNAKFKLKIKKQKFSKLINNCDYILSEVPSSIGIWANLLKKKYFLIDHNLRKFKLDPDINYLYFKDFDELFKSIKKQIKLDNKQKKIYKIETFNNYIMKTELIEKLN